MKETGKKRRILASALAVAMVAALVVGGGTFAYLQDESDEDVVNTFSTNKVLVDLYETDEDGETTYSNDYNIIPGTSEDKDPTVKVTATTAAYVFVKVTDNTDGLVTYDIEDGWTALPGVDGVYYREYDPDDSNDTGVYSVLEGDKVYYSEELENSNMLDGNGKLKDGITLSFTAYAVQKEPFANAAEAYAIAIEGAASVTVDSDTDVDDINEVIAAADEGETVAIRITEDVTFSDSIDVEGATVILSLDDDVTLTGTEEYTPTVLVEEGATLTIVGGTIDAQGQQSDALKNEGGTVTLENVTLTRSEENSSDNTCYVIDNHTGSMVLNDCTVTATGSNSSLVNNGANSSNEDPTNIYDGTANLTINGGTYSNGNVTVKNSWGGTLTINGGTFSSTTNATLTNWNVATINDGTFSTTNSSSVILNTYDSSREDAVGELTINGGTYTYPTNKYMIDHCVDGTTGSYCTDGADCAHITIHNVSDITMSNNYFYYNGSSNVTRSSLTN